MTVHDEIKQLSNSDLWLQTKTAAHLEKQATLKLLEYLLEVERRRLFAERAYSSLWDFVVKEFGYSEAQASERINAMRLMKDLSEVKPHIESGSITLTTASKIQRFFKAEKKLAKREWSKDGKLRLITQCHRQSKREVEKTLLQKASIAASLPPEKSRLVTAEWTELKFLVSEEVMNQIQKLKDLKEVTLQEIFQTGLAQMLHEAQKKNQNLRRSRPQETINPQNGTWPGTLKRQNILSSSRYIPKPVRDEAWRRSQGRCEFVDPLSQARCLSTFRLQIEHRDPIALGGKNNRENIFFYCQAHNQLAAMKVFGKEKMQRYFDKACL